jgi:hypothetical protein
MGEYIICGSFSSVVLQALQSRLLRRASAPGPVNVEEIVRELAEIRIGIVTALAA